MTTPQQARDRRACLERPIAGCMLRPSSSLCHVGDLRPASPQSLQCRSCFFRDGMLPRFRVRVTGIRGVKRDSDWDVGPPSEDPFVKKTPS